MYTVASHYSDPRNPAISAEITRWRPHCYSAVLEIHSSAISPTNAKDGVTQLQLLMYLGDIYTSPSLSACQALLLLAYEEMGSGPSVFMIFSSMLMSVIRLYLTCLVAHR